MSGLSKNELLALFDSSNIKYCTYEHHPVNTADEQISALSHVSGTVVKNLFLKDKKHRLYIVSLTPSTKLDLKVLSARLGLGKGGINFASAELVQDVLKVPLGSVTPFAAANAKQVILLLDVKIQSQELVLVHPLVNTSSLSMTPTSFDSALRCLGITPSYEDLELEPKVDKDNPPDLKKYTEGVEGISAEAPDGSAAAAAPTAAPSSSVKSAAANSGTNGSEAPSSAGKKGKKGAATEAPVAKDSGLALLDVDQRVDGLLQQALESLQVNGTIEAMTLARLRADMATSLNALKNAAYASGFSAGRSSMVAYARNEYA